MSPFEQQGTSKNQRRLEFLAGTELSSNCFPLRSHREAPRASTCAGSSLFRAGGRSRWGGPSRPGSGLGDMALWEAQPFL